MEAGADRQAAESACLSAKRSTDSKQDRLQCECISSYQRHQGACMATRGHRHYFRRISVPVKWRGVTPGVCELSDRLLNSGVSILPAGGYSRLMNRGGSQAAKSRPDRRDTEAFGKVLPFRRPGPRPLSPPPAWPLDHDQRADAEPADDFAQYEQDQDEVIDYRQRMLMNVIALAVLAFLISTGVWLADTIADMERDQDCMMQGRVNCAPLELPLPSQQ
jgi:hypothetical protein